MQVTWGLSFRESARARMGLGFLAVCHLFGLTRGGWQWYVMWYHLM